MWRGEKMQIIGAALTLTLRWPIWFVSAFAILLFVGFGSGWWFWIYPAVPALGTLILAALDWTAFSASFKRPSGPMAKFMTCLAIETALSAFVGQLFLPSISEGPSPLWGRGWGPGFLLR
jgi:hypothetical protein